MVTLHHNDGSRAATSDVIVDLIERHQDEAAVRLLGVAHPSVRAEAVREYLWREDKAGVSRATELLDFTQLSPDETRTIFTTAAEVGEISIMRRILKDANSAIDPKTVRLAFQAALHEERTEVITFLGETKKLSPGTKYRAIQPSIHESLKDAGRKGSHCSEMGTMEVVITAEYRNEIADRRDRRIKEAPQSSENAVQKKRWRVERKYQGLIEEHTARIRHELPPLPGDTPLHELEHRREVRDLLIAQCTREHTRQMEVALSRGGERSRSTASERSRKVDIWRATNPEECRDRRSFAEVVEDVFHGNRVAPRERQLNFSGMIDRVLGEWGTARAPLSREGLCQVMEFNHPEGRTLTNKAMYDWKNYPEQGPYQSSVHVIVEAFKLDKVHELMMWRIAKGWPLDDLENLIDVAEQSFRTPEERAARARLFTILIESSGIPVVRLADILSVSQMTLWKRGQSIADPEKCAKFVRLVNPPETYHSHEREAVCALNQRIEAFLGARPSSIFDAVFAAERSGTVNPAGSLLGMLTGGKGIRPLTHVQGAELLGVTPSVFRHMCGASDTRGAAITEAQANTILDWVQRVAPETRKLLSIVERAERRLAIDHLTGISSPVTLLVKLSQGELQHPGEIVRLTRVRRGEMQQHGMSDFELGKAYLAIPTAQRVADWLGFVGPEHTESRRLFLCFALGVDQSKTPDQIFDEVVAGTLPRHLALRKLFELTGKNRNQIAHALGLPVSSVRIMGRESVDGRTSSARRAIAVAREVGLLHRCDQFVGVFARGSVADRR